MVAAANAGAPIPTLTDGIVNVIQSSANSQQQQQQQQQLVDTSQPPPIRPPTSAALLPPPNTQLQMMPPAFTMPGVPREFIAFIISLFFFLWLYLDQILQIHTIYNIQCI